VDFALLLSNKRKSMTNQSDDESVVIETNPRSQKTNYDIKKPRFHLLLISCCASRDVAALRIRKKKDKSSHQKTYCQ
jgi:hypothetical protein